MTLAKYIEKVMETIEAAKIESVECEVGILGGTEELYISEKSNTKLSFVLTMKK